MQDNIYNFECVEYIWFEIVLIELEMRIFNDNIQEDRLNRYERCERR